MSKRYNAEEAYLANLIYEIERVEKILHHMAERLRMRLADSLEAKTRGKIL